MEHHLTVRRSKRLNPELHTKEVIDALNAETERQRLERQERLQIRRQKRQQKEDAEVSDTESVVSTDTNTGKAHQDARDQFDTYLANLKADLKRLEETPKSEKQHRLNVLHSAIDNYEDLTSIGGTFNEDREKSWEPRFHEYQQRIDEATTPEDRTSAEATYSLWEGIFQKGLCVIEQSIDNQVGDAYREYNELLAEPTTPPRTTIPDTSHEQTPTLPGQFKEEPPNSDDDDIPPSPTPQPKKPKEPELTTTPETTPVMAEKFKVPKPRTYTGDNCHGALRSQHSL
jgi:hypothetical protein